MKTIYRKIHIALDKTEFTNIKECKKHERQLTCIHKFKHYIDSYLLGDFYYKTCTKCKLKISEGYSGV